MIKLGARLFSGFYDLYKELNPSTLSGAIDIIVVEQPDGSLKCSPFYVRFGKIGVLRSRKTIVDIVINDLPFTDVSFVLDELGEAYFLVDGKENEKPDNDYCPNFAKSSRSASLAALMNRAYAFENDADTSAVCSTRDFLKFDSSAKSRGFDRNRKNRGNLRTKNYQSEKKGDMRKSSWSCESGQAAALMNAVHKQLVKMSNIDENSIDCDGELPQTTENGQNLDENKSSETTERGKPARIKNYSRGTSVYYSTDEEMDDKQERPGSFSSAFNTDFQSCDKNSISLSVKYISDQDIRLLSEEKSRPLLEMDETSSKLSSSLPFQECLLNQEMHRRQGSMRKASQKVVQSLRLYRCFDELSLLQIRKIMLDYPVSAYGCVNDSAVIDPEIFEKNKLMLTDFISEPDSIFSHDLMIQVGVNRYHDYTVAIPLLIRCLVFKMPIEKYILDRLCSAKTIFHCYLPNKSNAQRIGRKSKVLEKSNSWFWWRRSESADLQVNGKEAERTPKYARKSEDASKQSAYRGRARRKFSQSVNAKKSRNNSKKLRRCLTLPSDVLKKLNLSRDQPNKVQFSVTTKFQGTTTCLCFMYLWRWDDRIIVSDVDGTITRSDVLGHLMPLMGRQWEQPHVAPLYDEIASNGYRFLYLTARAIGQSEYTKMYLLSVCQDGTSLPDGPLQLSPTSIFSAFHREVIEKKPEIFKIECLRRIRSLFPSGSKPFYAGFGNRCSDELSYEVCGIPRNRIFTIDYVGQVYCLDKKLHSVNHGYQRISQLIDHVFPPITFELLKNRRKSSAGEFSSFLYWKAAPCVNKSIEAR